MAQQKIMSADNWIIRSVIYLVDAMVVVPGRLLLLLHVHLATQKMKFFESVFTSWRQSYEKYRTQLFLKLQKLY